MEIARRLPRVRRYATATADPARLLVACRLRLPMGSFDHKGEGFILSLGPFRGSFFHQGLQRFLFLVLPTLLAFAHDGYSLWPSVIGSAKNFIDGLHLVGITRPRPPLDATYQTDARSGL